MYRTYRQANPVRSRVTGTRRCPCTGCYQVAPIGALMCRNHWALVPKLIQREVWAELAKSQAGRGFTQGYRDARRQAIQFASGEVRLPYKEDTA